MSQEKNRAQTILVKRPITIRVVHQGEIIMNQIFQTAPIRIGRMLDNDVALPFDFVSRYHCEIRFDGKDWVAADLGSKNGFLLENTHGDQVRLERVNELKLGDGSSFFIQELQISLEMMPAEEGTVFRSKRGATDTFIEPVPEPITHVSASMSPNMSPNMSSGMSAKTPSHAAPAGKSHSPRTEGRPVVQVDLQTLLFIPHPLAAAARERALQMTTIWHDQILDTKEFSIGDSVVWEFIGERHDLGQVGAEASSIRVPRGCKPADGTGVPPSKVAKLTANVLSPTAFNVNEAIFVYFRYVPKSKELPMSKTWIDERLMDPLIFSSAVHGTAALTAIVLGGRPHPLPQADQPERFAKVIMPAPALAPTPAPTPPAIAAQPTPEPTPEPLPTPMAVPKKVAKKDPPPPKVEKVVKEKKLKKVALARQEDIAEKPIQKSPPKEKISGEKKPPVKVASLPEDKMPPAQGTPQPAAPTPQPFNAKSVGALKALSLLSAGPSTNVANVEKIQVSRAPASVSGTLIGAQATQGTGDMITSLNKSASGGGSGPGDGASGVAVGGKAAGGSYKVGGLTGKAGSRKIKGSVLGGATYTELSKNEGLTREQVMKEVQKHQSEIQQCYERSLMSDPDISGTAEFEWEIAAPGSVNFAKVKGATIKNGEGLLDCVKGVFTKMKFPAAKNGESTSSTINLPFGRL